MSVNIQDVLSQLDPRIRKRLGTGEGINFEYQPTPSFGLNRALGGGLPYGRQVLIWGSKSSAKSSMCLQMIALAQKEGKSYKFSFGKTKDGTVIMEDVNVS